MHPTNSNPPNRVSPRVAWELAAHPARRLAAALVGQSVCMDPRRKRAIRLSVALTAAVLLATALIYTSFSAGERDVTAAQLLKTAQPGQAYILAGTVLNGSVRRNGPVLVFRVR